MRSAQTTEGLLDMLNIVDVLLLEVIVEVGTELVGRDGGGLGGGGVVGRGGLTLSWDRCCRFQSLRSLDDGQAGTHLVVSLL